MDLCNLPFCGDCAWWQNGDVSFKKTDFDGICLAIHLALCSAPGILNMTIFPFFDTFQKHHAQLNKFELIITTND